MACIKGERHFDVGEKHCKTQREPDSRLRLIQNKNRCLPKPKFVTKHAVAQFQKSAWYKQPQASALRKMSFYDKIYRKFKTKTKCCTR